MLEWVVERQAMELLVQDLKMVQAHCFALCQELALEVVQQCLMAEGLQRAAMTAQVPADPMSK